MPDKAGTVDRTLRTVNPGVEQDRVGSVHTGWYTQGGW